MEGFKGTWDKILASAAYSKKITPLVVEIGVGQNYDLESIGMSRVIGRLDLQSKTPRAHFGAVCEIQPKI